MYLAGVSDLNCGLGPHLHPYSVRASSEGCSESGHFLFIIVLEVLTHEFRSGVPLEDLYADDLVVIADLHEECARRIWIWKEATEKKGLWVHAGKTKVMICGTDLDLLQSSGVN